MANVGWERMAAGLVSAVILVLPLLWAPASVLAQAQPDSISIRLYDAPTERRDDPRARTAIVDHVAPGSVIERRVEVTNNTSRSASIPVYVGGASLEEGSFAPADDDEGDLARWATVEPADLELEPGSSGLPVVRIAVPDDASEGERYGVIWAEAPRAQGGSIQAVNRVGVRVYLSVGPGGEPPSDFEIVDIVPGRSDDARPVIDVRLRNSGGRAIDIGGEASLVDGPGGISLGPVPVRRVPVAIGEEGATRVAFEPELPGGPWTVEVTLRSGELERRASASITFPDEGVAEPVRAVPAEREGPDGIPLPLLVFSIVLLLLVLALALLLLRRRREVDEEASPTPN